MRRGLALFLAATVAVLMIAGCGGSKQEAAPSPEPGAPAESKSAAPAPAPAPAKENLTVSGGTEFSAAWAVQQVLTHCRANWSPEAKLLRVNANTTKGGLIGESMVDFWMVFAASTTAPQGELCGGYVRRGRDALQNGIGVVNNYTPGHSYAPSETVSEWLIDSVDLPKQSWFKDLGWETYMYDLRIASHQRSHPAGFGLPKTVPDDTPVIWIRKELTSTNSVYIDARTGKVLHKNF